MTVAQGKEHRIPSDSNEKLIILSAESLASVDTVYSADCIEFCPHAGHQDIFICGTYQILQDVISKASTDIEDEENNSPSTSRIGRLLVYQVSKDQSSFHEIQRIDMNAILDAKWRPNLEEPSSPELAVADAKGRILLYALDNATKQLALKQTISVTDASLLCLSLDYSLHSRALITSLSSGSLAHLLPSSSGELQVVDEWSAHDYEPWITAFDRWSPCTVWSGGDDLKLKRWDLRDTSQPTATNKWFDGGVTTIACSPHTEHLLAVGSYDANLRLFDARSLARPLYTLPVGGGVWRTKFHPARQRKGDVLLACMHDGFKIVHLDEGNKEGGEIVQEFRGHESLAYGVDWSSAPGGLIASCSFYDHLMHLWKG
ncbi:diphthine methyl ester acylhydrolase, partial [Tremellales sp. Uapishka_1]